MRVPNYTKGLVLERATPNTVNLGQIEAAGAVSRGFADVANTGMQVAQQIKATNDMTAVNQAVIRRQKEDIDFRTQKRQEWTDNPIGYAKEIEPLYKERDKEIMEGLPSDEARQAYESTAQRLNLKNYEEDVNWENTTSVKMFANKADESIGDLEVLAYRGIPLDELYDERAATTLTLGSVLSPDELIRFDENADRRLVTSRMEGLIDTDPYQAKKELDSQDYDSLLGVDDLNKLTDKAKGAILSLEKAKKKQSDLNNQLALIESVKGGEAILDPKNTDHVKAVDADYKIFNEQIAQLPVNEKLQAQVDYVAELGVLPTQLESQTRAMLLNGKPEQQLQAADFIEKVAIDRPQTLRQFPEKDRALARSLQEGLGSGMNTKQATEFAAKNIFMEDTEEYKLRTASFKDESRDFTPSDFTEFFRDDPNEIPQGMIADYNRLNRKYYMDGGVDADNARELAVEKVKANWGITEVDGVKRWMKYAPEKIYDNEVDPEWMSTQLRDEVKDLVNESDELLLEVAPETVTEKYPSYLVFKKNESGLIEPVLKDGMPQAWRPDFHSSSTYQKLLKEHNNDSQSAIRAAKLSRSAKKLEEELIEEGVTTPEEVGIGRAF